jgi:flagellar basal body-associated protein FliL
MKKKILIILGVLVLAGGFAAKTFLMPPAKAAPQKIAGTIYMLPKQFTLNLQDGHYATLNVALELAPGQSDGATAASAAPTSDEILGTLPEEAAVRAIITNVVTGQTSSALIDEGGRNHVIHQILMAIRAQTDVKVDNVLFTDLAVQ